MIRVVRVRGRGRGRVRVRVRVRVRERSSRCAAPKRMVSGLGRNQMEESAVRRHELSVNALGPSG